MERKEIEEKVNEILVDALGIDKAEIGDEVRFRDDLCCDSLDFVDLLMHMEREFSINIPDDDAYGCTTIKDIYDLAERYIKG